MKVLYAVENGSYPLVISQNGRRKFEVRYGLQVKTFDDWQCAFEEFGYCLAHCLECDGKLLR